MRDPSPQQVVDLVCKGIIKAQDDYKKACESLLYWGPEYLITVNILQSLLTNDALGNSMVMEMKTSEVSEVKRRGPKIQNSRVGKRCKCDIVLWSDINKRRAVVEVKRYAQDCLDDLGRLLQLLKGTPSMDYAVLAACYQKEVKNDDSLVEKKEITSYLAELLHDVRKQARKNGFAEVELMPKNILTKIIALDTKGEGGDEKHWVWRPVCFVIFNKKDRR